MEKIKKIEITETDKKVSIHIEGFSSLEAIGALIIFSEELKLGLLEDKFKRIKNAKKIKQ